MAVAIHEVGHLIEGMLVGLDTGGIAVGGILLLKSGRNWTVRFDRRLIMGGFFKPLARGSNFHPSRYAWMIAGGPIASIALTAACGVISVLHGSGAWDWIGCICWVSLFIAIVSVLPYSSGSQKSDGALLKILMWHPDQTSAWTALLDISTEETNGARPREWNAEVFERTLQVERSLSEYPRCQLMAYYRRHDEGLEAVALQHLENVLATSARGGKAWRHFVFLEAAYTSAEICQRASQARTWLDRARKLRKPEPESLHAVQARIAMCEGQYEQAARHWGAAIERITMRRADSGLARFAKEKWTEHQTVCTAKSVDGQETGCGPLT